MQKLSSLLLTTLISIGIFALAHESIAQTSSAPSKAGTRLITLGTLAGPNPRASRAQSSNLLIVNGALYVVDTGDGVARRLAKAGINIRDIGTIFLTHHHDDHTAGLSTLLSVAWDQQRTTPINVYGPPRTVELVKAAVQYFAISAEIRIADGVRSVPPTAQVFFGHDVGTGVIYQDANIKVTAVENSHFDSHKGEGHGKHKSYSYRFETPHRVIVFTGDTGPSDAVTELAKGADLLVSEAISVEDRKQTLMNSGRWQAMTPDEQARIMRRATEGHLTLDAIGKMATRAGVKTVVLSHLGPRAGSDDYTPWAAEVKKHFSGEVLIAKDLMEF
jgi:ribonuclease BN (tRNA processing enzyme)